MYKEAFHRLNETVEASEALIQHTLQAASQRAARRSVRPWQLAGAMAAALCVVAALLLWQRPAPKDLVASTGDLPGSTPDFLPLANARADLPEDLTVTAGAATINEDGTISVPVTIRSESLQGDFMLSFSEDNTLLLPADFHDEIPSPFASGLTFMKNYKLQEGKTLADLGGQIDFTLDTILLVDVTETLHGDVLLSALPRADFVTDEVITTNPDAPGGGTRESVSHLVPGEPLIDLGNGCAVSAIGFNKQNRLVVQLRMPAELPWQSRCGAYLSLATATKLEWSRVSTYDDYVAWWDDEMTYIYYDFTFMEITPSTMDDVRLVTKAEPVTGQLHVNAPLTSLLPSAGTPEPAVTASQHDHLSNPIVQSFLAARLQEQKDDLHPIGLQTSHSGVTFEVIAACMKDGLPQILTAVSGDAIVNATSCNFSLNSTLYSGISYPSVYDESNHTKYYLISVTQGSRYRSAQDITLDLYDLRTEAPYESTTHHDLDLSAYTQYRTLQTVTGHRTDYNENYTIVSSYSSATTVSVMKPGDPLLSFPDGSGVTAIGLVNNNLRIQMRQPANKSLTLSFGDHVVNTSDGSGLSVSVMPRSNEPYTAGNNRLTLSTVTWSADGFNYTEYVLRITAENAANYVLQTIYSAPDQRIDGLWQISFTLPDN